MRRIALVIVALLALTCGGAWADDFSLPGLAADSDAYAAQLTKRFPAGGTPQARRQAEAQADAAIRKNDWTAAAAALETRVALGDAGAGFLAGARAGANAPHPARGRPRPASRLAQLQRGRQRPRRDPCPAADGRRATCAEPAGASHRGAGRRGPTRAGRPGAAPEAWPTPAAPSACWSAESPPNPTSTRRAPASTSLPHPHGATISTPRTG